MTTLPELIERVAALADKWEKHADYLEGLGHEDAVDHAETLREDYLPELRELVGLAAQTVRHETELDECGRCSECQRGQSCTLNDPPEPDTRAAERLAQLRTQAMNSAAAPTPTTPPTSVRLPADYEKDPTTGLNRGRSHIDVPILYDPELPTIGHVRANNYGPPRTIVLREWNEQVLLHEVLHCLLDGYIPTSDDDPHGHRTIARAEVAMWETGWRLSGGAS